MAINWYFPRTALANKLAEDYTDLGKERIAMFANRQKGKTHFCLNDLMPAMKERDYFPIYVDFWSNEEDPAMAFAAGIAESYDLLSMLDKPLTLQSFKLSTPKEFGIKAELGITTERPELTMSAADEAISHLLKYAEYKPIFIVLDEVQHLATSKKFESFVAKLRSFLINKAQRCKHPIKALFIGSDQARLAELFKSSKAPFYRATDVADFPDLGRAFTDFTVNNFESRMGVATLNRDEAYKIFSDGGKMPGSFTGLLKEMVSTDRDDLQHAVTELGYFANVAENYREHLRKVNAQDVAILVLLAREIDSIYVQQSLDIIGVLSKKTGVTVSSVQGSIRKLEGRGLVITKGHGVWEISDSAMKAWLLENTAAIST
jgi:hypothetical protein